MRSKFLILDTCGPVGSVALVDGATTQVPLEGRSSAEQLLPAIRQLLASRLLDELDAIAIVNGPGSFTGLRIGLSAAKALAEAANLPLIALSRLAVLASRSPTTGVVHAILDAGRGEFYHGLFGDGMEREALMTPARLRAALSEAPGTLLVCEQAVAHALADLGPVLVEATNAADALALAHRAFDAGAFADLALLDANYLRSAEVEMLARQQLHQAQAATHAK